MSMSQLETHTPSKDSKNTSKKAPNIPQEIQSLTSTKTTLLHRRVALIMSILLILIGLLTYQFAAKDGPSQPAIAAAFIILTIFAALLTANLLFGQFLSARVPSLAVLGGIYLYVSLINIPYLLTLPKVFAETGLFNAGLYAPSWFWIFWQVGYSCGIVLYVIVDRRYSTRQLSRKVAKRSYFIILLSILFLTILLSFIAFDPYHILPNIFPTSSPPAFIPAITLFVFGIDALMCIIAFFLLHNRSVLHLWLRLSILASFITVSLSLFTTGRYSVGWYVSRVNGLMTAIFVLYALLHEANKLYIRLALQNEQLAMQNRTQSDFLSIVGHEFRTALTGILGFSEMIREGGIDEQDSQEYADDIHNDAIRLTRLINDLLDLERMKSGHVAMNWGVVDINALIQEIVNRTYTIAHKDVIQLQLDAEVPSIQGDSDKLTQVITNLVNNAIKYSPEGGTILLSSKRENNTIHLLVQDHGIGIPTDKLEQVFERYARVESGATRYIGGTGLGLPIVRQIMEMHHGSVWAESVMGQGSTFHVVLPTKLVKL
jgi:two-component system sensor histidine kinase/response regulator